MYNIIFQAAKQDVETGEQQQQQQPEMPKERVVTRKIILEYLTGCGLINLIETMFEKLLETKIKPINPLSFMLEQMGGQPIGGEAVDRLEKELDAAQREVRRLHKILKGLGVERIDKGSDDDYSTEPSTSKGMRKGSVMNRKSPTMATLTQNSRSNAQLQPKKPTFMVKKLHPNGTAYIIKQFGPNKTAYLVRPAPRNTPSLNGEAQPQFLITQLVPHRHFRVEQSNQTPNVGKNCETVVKPIEEPQNTSHINGETRKNHRQTEYFENQNKSGQEEMCAVENISTQLKKPRNDNAQMQVEKNKRENMQQEKAQKESEQTTDERTKQKQDQIADEESEKAKGSNSESSTTIENDEKQKESINRDVGEDEDSSLAQEQDASTNVEDQEEVFKKPKDKLIPWNIDCIDINVSQLSKNFFTEPQTAVEETELFIMQQQDSEYENGNT